MHFLIESGEVAAQAGGRHCLWHRRRRRCVRKQDRRQQVLIAALRDGGGIEWIRRKVRREPKRVELRPVLPGFTSSRDAARGVRRRIAAARERIETIDGI